ncbi:MAG: BTAD domain-containing putative transcriptional regulator, partial [Gemmatimonadota bacterium]
RQPVRMALLLYLALERDASRDSAMALLWPERNTARARHALSQTVYELRRMLGSRCIRSTGGRLRVDEGVTVDALEVQAALDDGDCDRALTLYRGPFLDGWSSSVSSELDAWADGTRARLSRLVGEACRRKVEALDERGDPAAAVALARRWVEAEPVGREGRAVLVRLLTRIGDVGGAEAECRAFEDRLRSAGLERDERADLLADLHTLVETRPGDARTPARAPIARDQRPRVVVLPFEHLGSDEDRYLTEGMTDEVTARLARLPGLAVIARTSAIRYREPIGAIERVRRELDVDYAVQGTVRLDRTRGKVRVRISSRLIQVRDATHLWADSQQAVLGDVFRLQQEVAEKVAEAIGVELPWPHDGSAPGAPTDRLDAYEMFLRGRHSWFERTPESIRAAIDLFQQAISLDSRYARAYAGLAEAYAMMPAFGQAQPREWHPQAKRLADRALALDPESADAHSAAGIVAYVYDWDFHAAEHHLCRACELVPNHAPAQVWRAYVLLTTGHPGKAARVMDHAHDLDPVSVATNWDVGFHAWLRHDRQRALAQFARVLELNPRFDGARFMLGGIRYLDGDVHGAAAEWRKIAHLGPPWPRLVDLLPEPAEALRFLDRWVDIAPRPIYWYVVAALYALLGGRDQALHWLNGHYRNVRGLPGRLETSGANLAYVAHDPFFTEIRDDRRFKQLMERIGVAALTPS